MAYRSALITGGAQRIGKAITRFLVQAGYRVVIHYRHSAKEALALCEQIRAEGGEAVSVQADLLDPVAVQSLFVEAQQAWGEIHLLINNASLFKPGTCQSSDLSLWSDHFNVNLTAPFLLSQAFARQLKRETFAGQIINFIDQRIAHPKPTHTAYTITKQGLWTLTQMTAQEFAPRIRVNAIAPGPILPASPDDLEQFQSVAKKTPLKRAGALEYIIKTVQFFLENHYITGEMIAVDGGEHLL
ncbi:SDR family oxidoreductase [Magnetococcales bacterium HHB-1]